MVQEFKINDQIYYTLACDYCGEEHWDEALSKERIIEIIQSDLDWECGEDGGDVICPICQLNLTKGI